MGLTIQLVPLEMLLARVDLVAAEEATGIAPGRTLATGTLVGGGARGGMGLLLVVVVVRVGHSSWRRRSAAPCMIEGPFGGSRCPLWGRPRKRNQSVER